MKISVSTGRNGTTTVDLPADATVGQLKAAYRPSLSEHRKSFRFTASGTDKAVYLENNNTVLASVGVTNGAEVVFKDLGPQIGYRTVFVVEYAGPIAFMALYASRPSWLYGATAESLRGTQLLYIWLFIAHFVKREFETFFVHKFSRPTMPLRNLFKNCTYYWTFAAVIGYVLCSPSYVPPSSSALSLGCAALWGLCEVGNFLVHWQLSVLRRGDGDTSRTLPSGPLFSLVTCPNYTFEFLGWAAYSAGCGVLMSWVFTFAGLYQMTDWALKKHRAYAAADPNDASCKRRKSILPFLV